MKNILEDLEILILQNEDDFDRGSGKFILRNFIKEKQAEQLTLTDVGKGTELLPDFLYKDDYGIKIGYHGDTEVSKEWNEYLEKIR